MCAIVGLVKKTYTQNRQLNDDLNHIMMSSLERGRDGWGWLAYSRDDGVTINNSVVRTEAWRYESNFLHGRGIVIGNFRAEPTTEYVKEKRLYDQQPYARGNWAIVHNGTIANDQELRSHKYPSKIDSAAILEILNDGLNRSLEQTKAHFVYCIKKLKGSYAILAGNSQYPEIIFAACNYRPIWFSETHEGIYIASSRAYFPNGHIAQQMEPYSICSFSDRGIEILDQQASKPQGRQERALVVCSGGLDSVVAAAWAASKGMDVKLLHFTYGSRAQGPEIRAVEAVSRALAVDLKIMNMPIYELKDSPLLQADSTIAGGEAGAEFAHEWVPARNLVMLSVATALAEAGGFDYVVLGNNLEEAGAYPDNEPEFIDKFNDLLPYAVADGKRVRVIMPVGNLMKHEIVALGLQLGAPLDLTWSCYRAGQQHCGTCGPCYMRRTAFEINGTDEVIQYAEGEN